MIKKLRIPKEDDRNTVIIVEHLIVNLKIRNKWDTAQYRLVRATIKEPASRDMCSSRFAIWSLEFGIYNPINKQKSGADGAAFLFKGFREHCVYLHP